MPASMNISLPETMKSFVDEQVANRGYGSASEYIRELVRRDQKEQAQDRLEALLLQGLESGNPVEVTPAYWDALRQDLAARRKAKSQR